MKLPDHLIELLNTPHHSPLSQAVHYVADGWAVFPLAPRSKEPYEGSRGVKEATTDWGRIERWIEKYPDANLGGACGGFLVIDIDVRSGGKRPMEWQTRFHASGRGDGGGHLIYRLTEEQQKMGFKSGSGRLGPGMDIKTGPGNYIVLPDSLHPDTGKPYTSDRMPIEWLPDELAKKILESQSKPKGDGSETTTGRSILSHLLKNPPAEGGRNEWLTKVCGHYAKLYRKTPDLYFTSVNIANEQLPEPLDGLEVEKTAHSIWNMETSGHPEREFMEELNENAGWLIKGDKQILQPIKEGAKDNEIILPAPLGDFDIEHLATLVDPETNHSYRHVRLIRKHTPDVLEELIPAKTFGRAQIAKDWLAARECYVMDAPERPLYKSPDWASRLGKYVASQPAPRRLLARHLGWSEDDHAFLTHTHRIDSNGAGPYRVAQPDPTIRDSGAGQFEYGMQGTREFARQVLADVMTFHDEDSMAAFGAWWAANLVKQWVMPIAGMFPFMAIEAASESGKTDGAFGMMVKLSGSTHGAGYYTDAALRDVLASNLNGIVWLDDLDEPKSHFQTIRSLTMGGVLSKKSGDNFEKTASFHLVASLLLSGENLQFDTEKAMKDRAVLISPPSPVDRKSLKPGRSKRKQYDDITELRAQLLEVGGERAIAGHYLAMVSGWRSQVLDTYAIVAGRAGRSGARDAILRTGARVLDAMLAKTPQEAKKAWSGEGTWAAQLESYLNNAEAPEFKGDNQFSLKLLPWYIRHNSVPTSAYGSNGGHAAFVEGLEDDDPVIWFSPKQLAAKWSQHNNGRIDARLDTQKSIENQAKQAGLFWSDTAEKKRFRTSSHTENAKAYYYAIRGEFARLIFDRASE